MTQDTYTATVSGIAWAGYKASTAYGFTHRPTRAEVMARAGDFQQVTRIGLLHTQTTVTRDKLAPVRAGEGAVYRYSDGNTYTDGLMLVEAKKFQRQQNGGTITKIRPPVHASHATD